MAHTIAKAAFFEVVLFAVTPVYLDVGNYDVPHDHRAG